MPASGAWRPGDPVGRRRFLTIAVDRPFALEGGGALRDIDVAYETLGRRSTPTARNAVLVCHAWTGDSHAAGPGRARPPDAGLVGRPGRAGAGRSTPTATSSCAPTCSAAARAPPARRRSIRPTGRPYGSTLPGRHDPRHGARPGRGSPTTSASAAGSSVVGGSMGGMQVLEWGVMFPDRVRSLVADRHVRAGHAPSRSPGARSAGGPSASTRSWRGGDYYDAAPGDGPHEGLALARMVAQITFRTDDVFTDRFGRELVDARATTASTCGSASRSSATSTTTATSWSAASTPTPTSCIGKAMDLHDVGRGRGGLEPAMAPHPGARRWSIGISQRHALPALPAAADPRAARPPRARRPSTSRSTAPRPRRVPDRARPGGRRRSAPSSPRWRSADDRRPTDPTDPTPVDRRPAPRDAWPSEPAGPTTTRRWPRSCGHATTFVTPTVWTSAARMATVGPGRPLLQPLRQPDRARRSRTPSPSSRAPRPAWPSPRAWARSPRWCSALCSTGDHIVAQRQIYAGTQLLLQGVCPRFGIDVTFVDATEPGAFAAAVRPGQTMLVFAETPANPQLDAGRPRRARRHRRARSPWSTPPSPRRSSSGRSTTASTWSSTRPPRASPATTTPRSAWWPAQRRAGRRLWSFAVLQGANASPFDAMNGLRGCARCRSASSARATTALRLAECAREPPGRRLRALPAASPSHPQHDLAKRQMAYGGRCSPSTWPAGSEAGQAVRRGRCGWPSMATSLGGPETLVDHPANSTHVSLTPDGAGGHRHRARASSGSRSASSTPTTCSPTSRTR